MTEPLTAEREAEIREALLDPAAFIYRTTALELLDECDRLRAEVERLRETLAVFDGSPEDFVEGYKEMEADAERLAEALRFYLAHPGANVALGREALRQHEEQK